MITNERQYKITRAEAEKFRHVISGLKSGSEERGGVHPRLVQAEREALESQLADLDAEIADYEALKAATAPMIAVDSLDNLAEGLIKARIAAGISQKELADRLGLKEQQVQRYEAERYASASYRRLRDISAAIGVRIRNEILLPVVPDNFSDLVRKLQQVGIDSDFLYTRLLPSADAARAAGEIEIEDDDAVSVRAAATLERVFGWTPQSLFGAQPLAAPRFAAAEARFKMPAGRNQAATSLYAAYANYLAVVVLNGSRSLPSTPIPTDPARFRQEIQAKGRVLSLKSALHYLWDRGVPVLPLRDRGTFHGACWRYESRNVIVLKQTSKHEARWLFDAIHESFHAGQRPDAPNLEVIEADETSPERRTSGEEIAASQFAGDVTLNGRAEELAQTAVKAAQNSVERLKRIVPDLANREGVPVGALANYLAFRLSWQNINWWGAAANLQTEDADPWITTRDVFFERFPFEIDNDLDRQLLERALQ